MSEQSGSTDGSEHDPQHDPLRDQLRALDPASSLPAADPVGVARLLEDIMSDTETTESRSDHIHHRSPLTWIVAAAAAVVLLGAGAFLVLGQDDDGPQSAGDAPSTVSGSSPDEGTTTAQTVTELTSGTAPAAKCLTPEAAPEVVANQTTVFDGVVQSISGGVVTLRPTRFYAGDATDLVTVQAPSDDMQALLSGVQFAEGKRFLVAATDGRVTLCGFSDAYSDALAAVYEKAFTR
ncbi:hypothetical protein BH11ACT8_BH11ACT8_22680 [soil metagenome]